MAAARFARRARPHSHLDDLPVCSSHTYQSKRTLRHCSEESPPEPHRGGPRRAPAHTGFNRPPAHGNFVAALNIARQQGEEQGPLLVGRLLNSQVGGPEPLSCRDYAMHAPATPDRCCTPPSGHRCRPRPSGAAAQLSSTAALCPMPRS